MKVVFLETVEGSGTVGEVRDVAHGYARNFLLPRGLAAPATPSVLRHAETLAAIEAERQRAQDEHASELVGKLADVTLVTAVRVGEQGRLYGSVTNADIAEKAGEILGEELDRRRILLPEVLRSVGLYTVPIRLSLNVTTDVRVAVVDAEAPEGVAAAVQALLAPPPEEEPVAQDTVTAVDGDDTLGADDAPEPGDSPAEPEASAPASVARPSAAQPSAAADATEHAGPPA